MTVWDESAPQPGDFVIAEADVTAGDGAAREAGDNYSVGVATE
ncbi:MAG: hypothetical protein N3B01_09460 [Verrucomicrobiae bacterium]|nr:hypothetical protein [Verrucomicrobiae bacterium]